MVDVVNLRGKSGPLLSQAHNYASHTKINAALIILLNWNLVIPFLILQDKLKSMLVLYLEVYLQPWWFLFCALELQ